MTLPRIISVDDHVIEPPDLWTARAPARWRDEVPRVEPTRVTTGAWTGNGWEFIEEPDNPDARSADVWVYEDTRAFLQGGMCAVGGDMVSRDEMEFLPLSYDAMPKGAYDREARLVDMDRNHTDASLCFPSASRFCGQLFMNRSDPDVAMECLRIYNDWMLDEWSAGPAQGRLIPVTIVPLDDPKAAAAEVRRCADKGSHAIAFSECPPKLGLPSLYSGAWDPLIAACDETDTVINMHIGSSSTMPSTADDAFHIVTTILGFQFGMHAAIDWIMSGVLARFPNVRIALSEAQVGWMPFILERADKAWEQNKSVDQAVDRLHDLVPEPPSSYVPGRVFGCIFDDLHGLQSRDVIGMEQILFETDYPHADSTWPNSASVAEKLCDAAELDEHERWQLLRGNAIAAFGLDRYFGINE